LGAEKNAIQKNHDGNRLTFALAFPDIYEVAMSHLGLEILYHILNQREDIAAERVFAPWLDMEGQMRDRGVPLRSLESCRPIREFDVVGFSLQYELSYTNVLNMLDLAGIPVWTNERDETFPLIIAGGPSTTNPEPIADFFDAVLIGDGEEAVLEICDCVLTAKRQGRSKALLLEDLSRIGGVYIPSFFRVSYRDDNRIKKITPLRRGYPCVRRRILKDLDEAPYPTMPIVPWVKTVHDRLSVEIARGCKRGCRFCHAGFIYRPYRERRPERVETIIEQSLRSTGYEEVSFLSLSSGDYGSIENLLHRVMDCCEAENIAVSFPSLRVETLKPEMIHQIKRVRKTGFTLAPEAGTERLRQVINKTMDEEVLLQAAKSLYQNGWNLIKLYFMTGLPTETEDDVKAIVDLARRVLKQGKGCPRPPRLNVSVSCFVPKPHTPFQWEPQLTLEETRVRQDALRKGLGRGRIRFKWHDRRMGHLEGVFSRGDRRLSRVLYDAFKMGCRFDGWGEAFRWEPWCLAFERNGIDMEFYIRRRTLSETLPWSHIRAGVSARFLKNERRRAWEQTGTPPCRNECTVCGVCDSEEIHVISWRSHRAPSASGRSSPPAQRESVKLFLEFEKLGPARFLGHLDMAKAFHRAARRAGISLRHSQGFHPTPKISFKWALPLGFESLCEEMEWECEMSTTGEGLIAALNGQLPHGLRIRAIRQFSRESLPTEINRTRDGYLVAFGEEPPKALERRIQEFLRRDQWVISRPGGGGECDIRSQIETMRLIHPTRVGDRIRGVWLELVKARAGLLEIVFVKTDGGKIRPDRALSSILSLSTEERKQMRILKLGPVDANGK
jgi:radical SAM family uncharacterized protein/radical SAM-linked protein